ncbi:hypothetical protein FHS01_001938 [Longimicrobium terrae]|uniref:Uncharacterized protein n=1 Tax=Longimicrobium terrae TaxID=1639882 RepID=A0A841GWC1_9BACT|nr:hypothetical protein [Longimicrobium terrae]MBB6070318.1 hypothetical protein [Longimicrobium terrae]
MVRPVRARGRSTSALRRKIATRVPCISRMQGKPATRRADTLGGLLDPLVDSLAAAVSLSETVSVYDRRREARSVTQRRITELQTLFDQSTERTRAVLTPAEWALLPAALR